MVDASIEKLNWSWTICHKWSYICSTRPKYQAHYNLHQCLTHHKKLTLFIHSKVIQLWSHICWENFFKHPENKIEFWECPSTDKWNCHHNADKEAKISSLTLFPSKIPWDFSRKEKANNMIRQWQMCLSSKEINLLYSKTQTKCTDLYQRRYMASKCWTFKYTLRSPNSAYYKPCTNRWIQSAYRCRFFPCEENASPNMNICPCGLADLETRDHIL